MTDLEQASLRETGKLGLQHRFAELNQDIEVCVGKICAVEFSDAPRRDSSFEGLRIDR